jgi:hypothetical protein
MEPQLLLGAYSFTFKKWLVLPKWKWISLRGGGAGCDDADERGDMELDGRDMDKREVDRGAAVGHVKARAGATYT